MELDTIEAGFDRAGRISGAGIGALQLKEFLGKHYGVKDCKSVPIPDSAAHNSVDDVAHFCENLRDSVANTLSKGKFALIFGGDHSMAIGSIAGALARYGDGVAVVYIDAHADMNTFETSATGNIHGMPLAVCMGLGHERLKRVITHKLDSSRLFLLGTRSIDPGEAELLDSRDIEYCTTDYVGKHTANEIEQQLSNFIERNHISKIHLSLDIDVVDPVYAPATGVPEKNGLTPDNVKQLITTVFDTGLVRSMDIVEYNPLLDKGDRTKVLCEEIASLSYNLIRAL